MHAIITGGSSGLGFALAQRLAKQGYDIIIAARNAEKLEKAAEEIRRTSGRDVIALPCDLSVESEVYEFHNKIVGMGIVPDILVNNAGMYIYSRFLDSSQEQQNKIINLNVNSLATMCRLFGKDMAETDSNHPHRRYILNIASYSVYMPIEGFSLYASSKAFVRLFCKCIAKELSPYNIKVTAVAPAGMDTSLMNLRPGVQKLARSFGFLVKPDTIARISLRAMRCKHINYWIPLWYNVLFIPFLMLFQPLYKKVLD